MSSKEVVEASLLRMLSSNRYDDENGIRAGIGEGARAATPTGRGAATRRLTVRSATGGPQRVRAFMRVTASTRCGRVEAASSEVRAPHAGQREPAGLRFDAGGPGPLAEDRQ